MPDLTVTAMPLLVGIDLTGPWSAALLAPAFGMPGPTEWIILLVLGLLIFGRRLPEVGRNIGRSIVEFKRGLKGIEDEIDEASSHPPARGADQAGRRPDQAARLDASSAGDVPGARARTVEPHAAPMAGAERHDPAP